VSGIIKIKTLNAMWSIKPCTNLLANQQLEIREEIEQKTIAKVK